MFADKQCLSLHSLLDLTAKHGACMMDWERDEMKRRILAGLLVCLLMISLAAGCGAPPASLPETAAETRTTAETIKKQDEPTGPDTDPAESVVTTENAPDTVTAEPVVTTEVVPDTTGAAPGTTAAEPDPLEEQRYRQDDPPAGPAFLQQGRQEEGHSRELQDVDHAYRVDDGPAPPRIPAELRQTERYGHPDDVQDV